ncbi:ribonuclease H-like domain-containing protein [Candidatus Woesearchaeota archaeon]|nr:ribonuclease H-like domain-containing protein [Candidatus Woesearchaeota archaeon]MBW3017809.1 ribonuclease H-like domain-containing protein [Candidatus Woesearchaeota archaeon]
MIKNSFIFLPNISVNKEKAIWQQGVKSWNDFLNRDKIKGISSHRKEHYDKELQKAYKNLDVENMLYFQTQFPSTEQWRLYEHFKDDAVFLDIETCQSNMDITVIGMFDGFSTKVMLKGNNLYRELFLEEIQKHKLIVTFNGSSFDIPLLQRYFDFKVEVPHVDLRHVCSKIDLTGGLKEIELQLNIKRPDELELLRGHNAVELWKMWRATANKHFLDLLLKYNQEDVINLKQIADHSVKELWKKTFTDS